MQLSITCPSTPMTGWGGEIGGGICHSFVGNLCPAIRDFELFLNCNSIISDREIVLREVGYLDFHISQSPTPSRNGGSGVHN